VIKKGEIMKKVSTVILGLLLLSCVSEKDQWRITVFFPMTGFAQYLSPVREGLDLAAEQINASGGIGGRNLKLNYVDTASSPEEAVRVFPEVLTRTSPDLILSVLSSVSTALAPLVEEARIPTIAMVASDPKVPQLSHYIYTFYQGAKEEIDALEPVLLKNGIQDLTVLYQDDEYGKAIYQELAMRAASLNLEVVSAPFLLDGSDIKQKIEQNKESEAILIAGFQDVCLDSLQDLRMAGYSGTILGTSTLSTKTFWESPDAQGIWVASPTVYNPAFLRAADFSSLYSRTYDRAIHHNAAVGWDSLFLLRGLLEPLQEKRSSAVLDKLQSAFVFPGVLGDISKASGEKSIPIPLLTARILDSSLRF
jgi:branched-chain amino acid transport system substrate-binding protein